MQYILVNKLEKKESEAILISSLASFGAGLAKEIQDKKSSYFSKKDMIANFLGISTAFIIVKLLMKPAKMQLSILVNL